MYNIIHVSNLNKLIYFLSMNIPCVPISNSVTCKTAINTRCIRELSIVSRKYYPKGRNFVYLSANYISMFSSCYVYCCVMLCTDSFHTLF